MPFFLEVVHELRSSVLGGQVVAVHQLTHRLPQGPVGKVIVWGAVSHLQPAHRRLPGVSSVGLILHPHRQRRSAPALGFDRGSDALTGGGPGRLYPPSAAVDPLAMG
jgi:hypothetical protein